MKKKKIAIIISDIDKSLEFEWLIEDWNYQSYDLFFILVNGEHSILRKFISDRSITCYSLISNEIVDFKSIWKIYSVLKAERPDIVHSHLLKASFQGLLAAKLAGIHLRIHTRHHGSFHHKYHPKGVWIDRLINKLSTQVVAISRNVKNILLDKEHVREDKIHLVHHGFKLQKFSSPNKGDVEALRRKYGMKSQYPVIGVISRFFELKGIQYTIQAFERVLDQYPDSLLIMANARGPYINEIKNQLSIIPSKNYLLIPFETDIFSLYHLFDIHIHVPVDPNVEAFGQTYVEALTAGIPSIFTMSGVAPEFIKNEKNALVVDFENSSEIFESITKLLASSDLRKKLVHSGKVSVQSFKFSSMMSQLETLYE